MPASTKNERRLTGYRGDTNTNVGQIQHHSLYDDDMDNYNSMDDDNYEEYDEEMDDHRGDDRDDAGSDLSIPDPNIDFDLVYALHTFTATVEGQASVHRGDALTLLDDSNSYWWLVKVLKSSEVGYIPAENIETPHERLARLNSHRNIELTKRDIQDNFPKPPSSRSKKTRRVTLAKGVQFQSQIIYGSSDDESDYEAEFEHWNERMRSDDSDDDSDDDPYQYYEDSQNSYFSDPQTVDMYASSYTNQVTFDMHNSPTNHRVSVSYNQQHSIPEDEPIDYYHDDHPSIDSDIIHEGHLENETIKISLTPSIARGEGDRHSDGNIQSKLKKAAKLEKLLGGSEAETPKEKKGIRKFFSRSSITKKKPNELERRPSNASESSSILSYEQRQDTPTQIKIFPGNMHDFGDTPYKYAMAYASTTAMELIQQLVELEHPLLDDNAYQDYHIVIKTINGDEFTLVPLDRPLEIFQTLTAHLSTPMPSLKKARRISQLMGSEDIHMGGPKESRQITSEDQVQFYLYAKTRRVEEGEVQIKVSLVSPEGRVDKLVKVASSMSIRDLTSLLLEKFHILNGVVAATHDDSIKSLRLEGGDVVRYGLAISNLGEERMLDLDDMLLHVFGDNVPPIQYRRDSNPDRSSITVNITAPDKDETYFILKRLQSTAEQPVENSADQAPKPRKLARQDTPMPQQETTPTEGFLPPEDQMPKMDTSREITCSPDIHNNNSENSVLVTGDILSQLDEAIDDIKQLPIPQTRPDDIKQLPIPQTRPESVESIVFVNDFGMNELMAIIRGAAQSEKIKSKITHGRHTSYNIRSEISEVFKDSQARLDQLEKELDRIMTEALKVYF